jgi:hypothetical protein
MTAVLTNIDYWEKVLKYWKEEKKIANIGSTYYGLCCERISILEDIFKCIESNSGIPNVCSSQTEISDEEIEKFADEELGTIRTDFDFGVIQGMKWYREQLKQRQ